MKIRTKLALAFLVLSLLPLIAAGVLAYLLAQESLVQQALDQLESVAALQKTRLQGIADRNLERLRLLSTRTQLRLSLKSFLQDGRTAHQQKMNRILRDAQASIHDFKEISVVALDGRVVASTDPSRISTTYAGQDFFLRGRERNTADALFLDEKGGLAFHLSGPLRLDGQVIGVMAAQSEASNILSLVADYSGLGTTGETLLVKADAGGKALYLAPLRFDPRAAMERVSARRENSPVTQALSGKDRLLESAVDYRGHAVLAAARYVEDLGWGLVVKRDREEAFGGVRRLRDLLGLLVCVLALLLVFVSFRLAGSISGPIADLTRTAGRIADGGLSERATVRSTDEIGMLARAFNRMTDYLLHHLAERRNAEARIRHLNAVLRAIRNVNQLITTEKDRDRLIQAVPEKLTETRGYERAAVMLLDGEEDVQAAAASAADSESESIVEGLKNRPLPACAAKALAGSRPVLTASPDPICRACPMLAREDAGTCLTMRLEHAGHVYGLLFARLRPGFTEDPEERQLFAEAAQDVGLALYTMAQEEAHTRARADVTRLARFPNENPNPVLRVSRDGRIQYANSASVALLDFWKRSEGQALPEDWLGVVRESLQEEEIVQREIECGERIFSLVLAPVRHEGYVNIYGYEITRQKRLEGQLRQSEKMQAIGQLAGGIAHEFNNQLAVINGFAELGMRKLGKDSRLHGQLEQILAAGQRAGELTSQLLAYSREQVIQPEILNLNKIVQNVRAMLKRIISEDIQLKLDLSSDLGATKADRGQVSDVILNLVSNARDAMPKGGTILISTQNVQLHDKEIAEEKDLQAGPYVEIAVSDTGVGMDEDTRQRIFDPFFTTKEVGRGTGLGLAMVAGVVKEAGGAVLVYSEPGQGTAFKLLLPRVQGKGESIAPETVAEEELPGGAETLLVVEDEERVRCLLVSLLEEVGYRVMEANSGEDALRMAAERPGEIHLLLTDLVMPGMTGRELAERFRKLRPEARVLYASGYGRDQISERRILEPGLPFVQKPFRTADLLRKVRSVLDESQSAVDGEA